MCLQRCYNVGMEDAKEEIRARLAVEDVIGQYIELKRAGRNFKGHSPWGTDKTPSFMVSPEKGIWHDFSSNKGGDIFTFVMEMEGITFREALEKLAQQAGVELKRYSGDDKKMAEHKARLYEALELATKYFQFCLTKNKAVMNYVFYKRNLNKNTVEKFRIGYAPKSGRALVDFLTKRGFSKKEIEDAGLVNRFGGDLFKGRMTVPLMDVSGRVIGFTARIIEKDENSPKYLNTPETLLYNKGRHIFGLSQAKDAIRRSEFVVVVEGNMDVISSHQAGVCEAVATAGTAMTEMHLKSFARMTNDIRLAYDGDEAGVRAAERAISMASKFGIYLSVIDDYHGCKDADELIQKDPALWQKATQSYRPALEWLLEKYEGQYNLRTEKGFAEYAAAAKKNKFALKQIGFMYRNGKGVPQDYHKAMLYYREAVNAGLVDAWNNIGFLYMNGYGVSQDYRAAMDCYQKAAAAGNTASYNNIGYMYHMGLGVPVDYGKAMEALAPEDMQH